MPVEAIQDPSIQIEPSKKLIEFIWRNVKKADTVPSNVVALKKSGRDKQKDIFLELDDIKWLNEYLKEHRKTKMERIYLHDFITEADIKLPTPKVTPRNPELEARIQKLRAQQNAREYEAMTKGVDSSKRYLPEDTMAYQSKISKLSSEYSI